MSDKHSNNMRERGIAYVTEEGVLNVKAAEPFFDKESHDACLTIRSLSSFSNQDASTRIDITLDGVGFYLVGQQGTRYTDSETMKVPRDQMVLLRDFLNEALKGEGGTE